MKKYFDHPHAYHRMAVLTICLLVVVIYSNTLNCGFVFDDQQNITLNPHIRVTDLGFEKLYAAAFKSTMKSRPVANISFALNYYFGKYNTVGYHLVNILIHLTNGILVYFLAVLTLKRQAAVLDLKTFPSSDVAISATALFAALIFVAHPIQVQSVTYIVQRMNSMATMFYLLALIFYVCSRSTNIRWQQWIQRAGCLISWMLALGSKEIAATLPVVVLLYEWYFFQNLSYDWLKKNLLYVIGLTAVLGVVAYMFLGPDPFEKILGSYVYRDFSMTERVLTQFRVLVYYLDLFLYPHPAKLNLLHYITTSHSLLNPAGTLFSLLFLVCLLGLAVYLAKKQRLISFCILWFFIHLVIESSFIGLEIIFEHRLYLPMFGLSLLAAYLLFYLFSIKRTLALIVATVTIVLLATATYLRNNAWQDPVTLWSDVVSKSPLSSRAQYNLGSDLARLERFGEAVYHFSEALKLKPDYGQAHNNLGLVLLKQEKFDQAADHFSEALRIQPGNAAAHYNLGLVLEKKGDRRAAANHYLTALQIKPDFAEAHNSLGVLLQEQGRIDQAVDHFSRALEIRPDYGQAHNNMGNALEKQGHLQQAIDHYFTSLKIHPDDALTYNNLGVALTRQGLLEQAVRCYGEALRLKPGDAGVHNNLGVVLQRQGKLTAATDHYSEALKIKPDYAEAHNNMGIVLARKGDFKAAVYHFSEALQIRPGDEQARHNLALARRAMGSLDKSSNTEKNK